jgi:hypothetical protein
MDKQIADELVKTIAQIVDDLKKVETLNYPAEQIVSKCVNQLKLVGAQIYIEGKKENKP